ncbi:MAG: phosphoribosylanthranilate isomerase [Proteobacteria bacterium]|nr:phosphoribosylanthranilate isomerase [Pseudomonadota bacterium]
MTVRAKICGINAGDALEAAVAGGAAFVGFVFYPPSPRNLSPEAAAGLASAVPAGIVRTGLFVDADDATILGVLARVPLEMLQLHGAETPARAAELRERTGLKVMKVIGVEGAGDLARAEPYLGVADWLMFDAKPPRGRSDALPGGNARAFDWGLLKGRSWPLPWMLAGGLGPGTVAEAVRRSGASVVDVSSGVEDRRGHKSPALIREFLAVVGAL